MPSPLLLATLVPRWALLLQRHGYTSIPRHTRRPLVRVPDLNYACSWTTEDPGPWPAKLQAVFKAISVFDKLDHVHSHLLLSECKEMGVRPLGSEPTATVKGSRSHVKNIYYRKHKQKYFFSLSCPFPSRHSRFPDSLGPRGPYPSLTNCSRYGY